jgi:SAM-dependent methyltransferase
VKETTHEIIKRCLKFNGGRSRPDKSFPFILPVIANHIKNDTEILDVGCGRGSAALILKNEFPNIIIDGIDIHSDYLDNVNNYRTIFNDDYTTSYRNMDYDIYLFIDVLEHFNYSVAVDIISYLRSKNKKIILSIPIAEKHWHQDETFERNNPHEAHLHDWTVTEVEKVLKLKLVGETDAIGVFQCNML